MLGRFTFTRDMKQRLLLVFMAVAITTLVRHTSIAQPVVTILETKSSLVTGSLHTRINQPISFIVKTTDSTGAPIANCKIVASIIKGPDNYSASFLHDSLRTNLKGESLITFTPKKREW